MGTKREDVNIEGSFTQTQWELVEDVLESIEGVSVIEPSEDSDIYAEVSNYPLTFETYGVGEDSKVLCQLQRAPWSESVPQDSAREAFEGLLIELYAYRAQRTQEIVDLASAHGVGLEG